MESAESDLLVDIASSKFFDDADPLSNENSYDDGKLKICLVQDVKHASSPEHEGNINCAMDIFAPDQNFVTNLNGSTASPGHQVSLDSKQSSDTERLCQDKINIGGHYESLNNGFDQLDAASVANDSMSSEPSRDIVQTGSSTPTDPILKRSQCTSPHFPKSNISFPSVSSRSSPTPKNWSAFGDNKENTLPSSNKPRYFPVRAPPAIPERKSFIPNTHVARSSPIQTHTIAPSPVADLLSMGTDDLQNHLSDTGSPITSRSFAKPAIPPRKSLFSTSSTSSKTLNDMEIDFISSPSPEGHINQAHSSSASSSPLPVKSPAIKGPPVPPRKYAPKRESDAGIGISFNDVTDCSKIRTDSNYKNGVVAPSMCSSSWANFDDNLQNTNDAQSTLSGNDKSVISKPADGLLDGTTETFDEDSHWSKHQVSPEARPTVKKKGAGGIGYLSLENDDFDTAENFEPCSSVMNDMITVSPPVNDLSPVKPLSQWTALKNECDDDEANNDNASCGAMSLPSTGRNSSGFAGSFNDVDVADLEDFVVNPNRLSTEMPNLKGFNRADRGSQNNLVDFSDDRGSAVISMGSHEDAEEDVETIFDLTAQGDSLKRKRPKGSTMVANTAESQTDPPDCTDSGNTIDAKASFQVSPAALEDSVFTDEIDLFDGRTDKMADSDVHSSCSSRAMTPLTYPHEQSYTTSHSSVSTNPFWSPSPKTAPSPGSASTDTPFDNVTFASSKTRVTPIRINPTPSSASPAPLIRIPPPPSSGSRSSSRQRRSSRASERTRHSSRDSNRDSRKRLDLDSVSDFGQSVSTLSSSRAETPVHAAVFADAPHMSGNNDSAFEPFPAESWHSTLDTNKDDPFSWLDDKAFSEVDSATNKSADSVERANDARDIRGLDDAPSQNSNTNAHTHPPEDTLISGIGQDIADELSDRIPLASDLLKSTEGVLVESTVDSLPVEKQSVTPEIDLVEDRSSWDVFMRFPPTKRAMSNRKWVPIHVKLAVDKVDVPRLKLYYTSEAREAFRTISLADQQIQITKPKLQPHYSDDGQLLGKLHSLKLLVVQYKEKQTFSPGKSLTRNAAGFKHASKGKQTIKLGFSLHYDVISFVKVTGDAMFYAHKLKPKLNVDEHTATVKYHSRDEFLVDVLDEVQAAVSESGAMDACKVRVRVFVGSFLSGDPMAKITINDRKLEGKEVVRRKDIIPTSLDGWIDVRDPELHECCTSNSLDGDNVGTCTLYPPDACRFELLRFATNYTESELPVIVKSNVTVKGARLQLRCLLRIRGSITASKDPLKQISCDDVMVRFPVPEEWGVFFRVEGKFRHHSVRARRAAKPTSKAPTEAGVVMEVSVGVAKYENAYQAIVWRIPRLPEKGAAQNTPHVFTCRMELVSDQELGRLREVNASSDGPDERGLDPKFKNCEVEYTMVGPTASKVCVRSVCLPNTDRAEKFVSYQSHYFYKVGIGVSLERICAEDQVDPADFCVSQ